MLLPAGSISIENSDSNALNIACLVLYVGYFVLFRLPARDLSPRGRGVHIP